MVQGKQKGGERLKHPPKFKLEPPVCSWDWQKMSEEEKEGKYKCRCWNECPVLRQKKADRIANARGFWQQLLARLL